MQTHHDLPLALAVRLGICAGLQLRGEATEHSRPENNGDAAILGEDDGHAAGVGEELHHREVLGLPAGHVDGRDLVALAVHLVDDVPRLQRDRLHREVELAREVAQPGVLRRGGGVSGPVRCAAAVWECLRA